MAVLKVYKIDNASFAIPVVVDDDKCYCDHNMDGADTLTFEIQRKNENHIYIVEEAKVEAFGNRFIIKKIDEHSDFSTINCNLDLDDWKAKINKNFRSTNSTIDQVLLAVVPNGWTINYGIGVDLTKRTTVELQEGKAFLAVMSYNLLNYIADAYSVVFNFDTIHKSIYVVNPDSFQSSGEYFIEDLNMTEFGYNGDSTDFATRIYAYGKDGLTFKDINGNREYVENMAYLDKVVSYVVTDERYTDKQHLLDYARAILDKKCLPKKSYTCKIRNFNGDIWLYKIVTIVDKNRKTRVNHQCIKYREYKNHHLDVITLSTQAPSIERIVEDNIQSFTDLLMSQQSQPPIIDLIQQEIDRATDLITGNRGGHFKWIFDNNGEPIELLNLGDTNDINTSQKVWRWNSSGLGHSNNGYNGLFDIALTRDGEINAAMMTTGVLNAAIIRAGILADVNNTNFWNLETGEFSLSSNATVGGNTVSQIASAAVGAQTQLSIFNKLTNNGQTQGIYLNSGKLYINGSYIKSGAIQIKDGDTETFYANTSTGVVRINATGNSNITMKSGSINLGSGNFIVTSAGAVTIKNGSINLGSGNFVVTSAGAVAIKSGSINLGSGNFVVTSGGVLTANSATIKGTITSQVSGECRSVEAAVQSGDSANYYIVDYSYDREMTVGGGKIKAQIKNTSYEATAIYGGANNNYVIEDGEGVVVDYDEGIGVYDDDFYEENIYYDPLQYVANGNCGEIEFDANILVKSGNKKIPRRGIRLNPYNALEFKCSNLVVNDSSMSWTAVNKEFYVRVSSSQKRKLVFKRGILVGVGEPESA